jgi:hypothetical protein
MEKRIFRSRASLLVLTVTVSQEALVFVLVLRPYDE